MRTTLDLEDQLLSQARRRAAERNATLTSVVEEALRQYLTAGSKRPASRSLARRWVVVTGKRPPSVDIADRDRLYDAMEGRRR